MSEYCINVEGRPYGIHAGPVNTWSSEEDAQKVVDHWLKNKVSWAHDVILEEEMTKKGKRVSYRYIPKNISVSEYKSN